MSINDDLFDRYDALTFDDVVVVPGYSETLPDAVDTTATFAVRDHGPGLPEGGQERLFERFVQGAEEPAEEGGERRGFGLGLSIAYHVVRQRRSPRGVCDTREAMLWREMSVTVSSS